MQVLGRRPAGPETAGRRAHSRLMPHVLLALAAALAFLLSGGVDTAGAQQTPTPGTLVSNLAKTANSSVGLGSNAEVVTSFTTGGDLAGYTLTSIRIQFGVVLGTHAAPRVSLRSGSRTGAEIATLSAHQP